MRKNNNLKLVYIHNLGVNSDNKFTYVLYFIEKDLILCSENWKENIAGLFNDKFIPDDKTIKYSFVTSIPLGMITNNLCLGMKHAIDGIVALAWEDITDYEEYPEDGRLIFNYGIFLEEVIDLLDEKGLKLQEM